MNINQMNRRESLKLMAVAAGAAATTNLIIPSFTNVDEVSDKSDSLYYKTIRLDNGFTAYISPNNSGIVSGLLRSNYGAINEEKQGIAHLLEHTFSKSGAGPYSSEETLEIWESFIKRRSATQLEKIEISVGFLPGYVNKFLDISSKAFFELKFEQPIIDQEKKRVLQEIAVKKSSPSFEDLQKFRELMYGKNHPFNYFFGGDEEVIKVATKQDLQQFYYSGFRPQLMELFLVGKLPFNIDTLIEKYFGQIHREQVKTKKIPIVKPLSKGIEYTTNAPDLRKGHINIYMGWNTDTLFGHKDVYTLAALERFLSYGSKSYLHKEVSDRRGLVYAIESSYTTGPYNSGFYIFTDTSSNPEQLVEGIFKVMGSMKDKPVEQKLLDRYVLENIFHRIISMQDDEGKLKELINIVDYKLTYKDVINSVKGITPQQIMEAAREYLPLRGGAYILMQRIGSS